MSYRIVCGVSAGVQSAPDELHDHVLRAGDDAHVLPPARCGSARGLPTPAGRHAPAGHAPAASATATDDRGGPQAGQGHVPQHGGPGHQVCLRG